VTRDTLAMVLGPHSRSIAIPVTTGGRLGAVTIFEDTAARRWLVRCENVARSERDQAYQLWLFTEAGVRSARTWALDQDAPWVALIDLPVGTAVVGVALSIEPRGGSAEPTGPTVFTHVW
jgi:hypothetical protein